VIKISAIFSTLLLAYSSFQGYGECWVATQVACETEEIVCAPMPEPCEVIVVCGSGSGEGQFDFRDDCDIDWEEECEDNQDCTKSECKLMRPELVGVGHEKVTSSPNTVLLEFNHVKLQPDHSISSQYIHNSRPRGIHPIIASTVLLI
jgi:hypothetical protein